VTERPELWVPTSTTHATVQDHNVTVQDHNVTLWDSIEFEKRKLATPITINTPPVFKNEDDR
jgi:hypothetical protein